MSGKYIFYAIALFAYLAQITACKKWNDYKKYQKDGEIIYPGALSNPKAAPGNGRVQLSWNPSIDPKTSKYVIYWNSGLDSIVVNVSTHNPTDTFKVVIDHLPEMAHNFTVYTLDEAGNRSVPVGINNIRAYGTIYRSGLINRALSSYNYTEEDNLLSVQFGNTDTVYMGTAVTYTAVSGQTKIRFLTNEKDSVQIADWKIGTKLLYQSSFKPSAAAIDSFRVSRPDTLSVTVQVPLLKSLFAAIQAPYDLVAYTAETGIQNLWSGRVGVQYYPNIFHSSGSPAMPNGTISFDMGKLYNNLSLVEETGRDCCHNPTRFEIWGIADTTGAFPALPGGDAQWATSMQAKGWTLLLDAERTDEGVNPQKFELIANPPPVRFIRVRFKATANNSDVVNLSQLSFWYRL
ncbi:DUF4998 domain-containing protein [Niabella drilacis]|uniref:Uncharacterized protein n=1 Tax=Niabella drilacis (strain DSM 25811 / CCM 8410 / CCUG 62505 / LMG 26954 / E90) TaxID=1285928 RepID=A0A1G6N574_NIADE|nr:DUF4998 domain-containing protein [Niabella drilacis]SDC62970.1 protein of unknown function [Niabella drilacis]